MPLLSPALVPVRGRLNTELRRGGGQVVPQEQARRRSPFFLSSRSPEGGALTGVTLAKRGYNVGKHSKQRG